MSTTTQILFNSPALHSLKRQQLIRLCHIHSIKASGKNIELVEKLKKHAETLPKDSPLSVAARSERHDVDYEEDDEEDKENDRRQRPSEQWELMESIKELDESSSNTLSSFKTLGSNNTITSTEFGMGSSKCTSFTS